MRGKSLFMEHCCALSQLRETLCPPCLRGESEQSIPIDRGHLFVARVSATALVYPSGMVKRHLSCLRSMVHWLSSRGLQPARFSLRRRTPDANRQESVCPRPKTY